MADADPRQREEHTPTPLEEIDAIAIVYNLAHDIVPYRTFRYTAGRGNGIFTSFRGPPHPDRDISTSLL